jgi:hypothetical protein
MPPRSVVEYGLQYAPGGDARMFGDPAQIAACPVTDRFYLVDAMRPGLLRLCPRSRTCEQLLGAHHIRSVAVDPAGMLWLIIDGALALADPNGMPRIVRAWSASGARYLTVSAACTGTEVVLLDADGVAEVCDASGTVLWTAGMARPGSDAVFALHCGEEGLCIVHERNNIIQWYTRSTGAPTRRFGSPGADKVPAGLFAPKSITRVTGGYAIADSYNNRVVGLTDHAIAWIHGAAVMGGSGPGQLWRPVSIAQSRAGLAIADSKNGRVVLIDPAGRLLHCWGASPVTAARLRLPRSISRFTRSRFLVADTHNDRLAVVGFDGETARCVATLAPSLAWPRCARWIGGRLWISEGRADRVRIGRAIRHDFFDTRDPRRRHALVDPHDMLMDAQGGAIVTNTGADQILRIDGGLHAEPLLVGAGLSDPHSTCLLDDGTLVVADTGNHRLLIARTDGVWAEIRHIYTAEHAATPLAGVRHCSRWAEGLVLLTLTDVNMVVMCDLAGREVWRFGPIDHTPALVGRCYHYRNSFLHGPKWACRVGRDLVAIGDTGNSRILFVVVKPAF